MEPWNLGSNPDDTGICQNNESFKITDATDDGCISGGETELGNYYGGKQCLCFTGAKTQNGRSVSFYLRNCLIEFGLHNNAELAINRLAQSLCR